MQTHVFGAFSLSREVGKRMVRRGRGSILMISSMAALMAIPQVAAYSVAKTSVLGLMLALVAEYSPHGVRINTIAPGWMDTDMVRNALAGDSERERRVLGRTPLGRLGDAMDVGHAAVFLCSPAAQFITGVVLPVDGGASIGF
jgi:gluconate 5-dehydrogenase